jgi:hypothetical protein
LHSHPIYIACRASQDDTAHSFLPHTFTSSSALHPPPPPPTHPPTHTRPRPHTRPHTHPRPHILPPHTTHGILANTHTHTHITFAHPQAQHRHPHPHPRRHTHTHTVARWPFLTANVHTHTPPRWHAMSNGPHTNTNARLDVHAHKSLVTSYTPHSIHTSKCMHKHDTTSVRGCARLVLPWLRSTLVEALRWRATSVQTSWTACTICLTCTRTRARAHTHTLVTPVTSTQVSPPSWPRTPCRI